VPGDSLNSTWWRVRTLVLSFVLKYGSSTVVSLLLRTTPVFLKSPRHVLYFLGALGLVQLFPGDGPFRFVQRSPWAQLVLGLGCSFYKVRKLLFVVDVFASSDPPSSLYRSWVPMLFLAFLALDGGSLARRLENVLSHRGVRASSPRKLLKEVWLAFDFVWTRESLLLVCASALHLTANTRRALEGKGRAVADVASWLHVACQVAALLVFLERFRVVTVRPSESLLYQIAWPPKPKAD
jgi:hypothetical protein